MFTKFILAIELSLTAIPTSELLIFKLFISTFEFSPTLIDLSSTLLVNILFAKILALEKSKQSFPIFSHFRLSILDDPESTSSASDFVFKKVNII